MSRPRKSWFAVASALTSLAVVASACSSSKPATTTNSSEGGSGGSASAGANTGSGSATLTKLKVGMIPAGSAAGFLNMAQEKGYYKDCGVDLQVVQVSSGAQLSPAIISGSVDMAIESPQQMLLAVAKGVFHAKVIGSVMPGLPWAIYGGKGVTSLDQLKGKSIATSSTTSLNTIVASLILKKHGIDPSNVKWVNAGSNADKFKAVVNGVTQGASAPSDYIPQAKKDGVNVLTTAAKDLPEYPRWTVIARDDYLSAHPKAAECYLAAQMRGERYAFDHPDEAKALAAKDIGGGTKPTDPIVTDMYQQIVDDKLINRNVEIPTSMIDFQETALMGLGLLKKKLPMSEIYDDQYRQAALKMVGGSQ